MTQWIRRIGRQITNALPAWRTNMAVADRLYNVSADIPSSANSALTWPGKSSGAALANNFTTNSNYANDVIDNYASGTLLLDDAGAHGSMVFGVGGHTRLQTQMLRCRLSEDAPTWDWFQHAVYETADVNGADHYWNPSVAAGYPSNRQVGESIGSWDGGFPMAFGGWVYPRKIKTGAMSTNVIHGYRFNCVAYVPASVTGFGVGGFLANNHAPQGPFSQNWLPSGVTHAQLCDAEALDSTTLQRRDATCVRNVSTGAWTRVPGYAPYVAPYGEFIAPTVVVSSRTKRAYVLFVKAGQEHGFYYVDLASGVAAATYASAWTRLLGTDGAAYPSAYSMAALTEGFSRDLLYAVSGLDSRHLVLMDLDAGTATRLSITNTTAMPNAGTLMYDKNQHRLLHVHYDASASLFRVVKIAIPSDVTNAASYSVTTQTIAVDGTVSFTAPSQTDWFGRISYHPGLNVVLIARPGVRLAGFVPS